MIWLIKPMLKERLRRHPRQYPKKKKFNWTGKHQEAFSLLKTHLTSTPAWGYPDLSRPFELETDASLQVLGAVLSQRDENGKNRVIAYASRYLLPNEQTM